MDLLVEYLKTEFNERRERSSQYSMRAYSRDLGINLTSLSLILRGQRVPSAKLRESIVSKLGLPEKYNWIDEDITSDSIASEKELLIFSSWYMIAILNLASLPEMKAKDFADRLNLPLPTIKDALGELIKNGHIELVGKYYHRISHSIFTSQDIPSFTIRNLHKGYLNRAVNALDNLNPEDREFSSSVFLSSPSRLAKAKELLRKFREELLTLCELDGQSKIKSKGVYAFCFQFFPLEERKGKSS